MEKRVAVYARVSTDDQTIESQIAAAMKYCESKGWHVRDENKFIDDGISGAQISREALDRMWALIRKGKFDALVIWKYDRIARDTVALILTLDELKGIGMDYISIADHIDTTTPIGRFQYIINAGYAEMQRTATKQNCRIGIDYALKKGIKFGRAGWKSRSGCLSPEQIESVKQLAARGFSQREIVNQTRLGKGTVWRILNPPPLKLGGIVASHIDEAAVGF
jgi:DNA invertase Pin-like site-specific DNA recombinase